MAPKDARNRKVNFLRLKDILISLGLVNDVTANSDSNERVLINDLWKLLKGEELEEVSLDDVKILIMGILRMSDSKRIGVENSTG